MARKFAGISGKVDAGLGQSARSPMTMTLPSPISPKGQVKVKALLRLMKMELLQRAIKDQKRDLDFHQDWNYQRKLSSFTIRSITNNGSFILRVY